MTGHIQCEGPKGPDWQTKALATRVGKTRQGKGALQSLTASSRHSNPKALPKHERHLTSRNADGNCTYPTFMANPQYHLVIHPQQARVERGMNEKTKVALTLLVSKDVNVAIVRSQGSRE